MERLKNGAPQTLAFHQGLEDWILRLPMQYSRGRCGERYGWQALVEKCINSFKQLTAPQCRGIFNVARKATSSVLNAYLNLLTNLKPRSDSPFVVI